MVADSKDVYAQKVLAPIYTPVALTKRKKNCKFDKHRRGWLSINGDKKTEHFRFLNDLFKRYTMQSNFADCKKNVISKLEYVQSDIWEYKKY